MFHGFLHVLAMPLTFWPGESASNEILSLRLLAANYTLILTPLAVAWDGWKTSKGSEKWERKDGKKLDYSRNDGS